MLFSCFMEGHVEYLSSDTRTKNVCSYNAVILLWISVKQIGYVTHMNPKYIYTELYKRHFFCDSTATADLVSKQQHTVCSRHSLSEEDCINVITLLEAN